MTKRKKIIIALIWTGIFLFLFSWSCRQVFAAEVFTEGILNYPTASGPVDFFYLWYPENEFSQTSGEWVRALATVSAGFDGFVLTAPSGYEMKDCRGVGVALYADSTSVKSIAGRFILQSPAMFDDDLGIYVNQFYNPRFLQFYYWSEDDSSWHRQDLGAGIINEAYSGDNDTMCLLDFTFCASNYYSFTEGSTVSTGNFMVPVYFDASYNQQIFFRFIDGFYNLSDKSTVWLAMAQSTVYSGPDLQSISAIDKATQTLNNCTALYAAQDPYHNLAIAAALAAVYNPAIDALFTYGGPTLYIVILLFVALIATVVIKWLRRE